MRFLVYKCVFGLSWFGLEGNSSENGSKPAIYVLPDTPTPKRRSPCLGRVSFVLADQRQGFCIFLIRLGLAMLRLGEPLHLGVTKLRPTSYVFGFSLSLSLTTVYWINENPNK